MNRTVHFTWAQGYAALPPPYRKNLELWQAALPNWTIKVWDIEQASERWPDFARIQHRCFHHATRSDIIQSRVMRDIGGIYVGTDTRPMPGLQRFVSMLEHIPESLVVDPKEKAVMNCLSYTRQPGSRFWDCAVNHQMRNECGRLGESNVHWATGPGCLWEVLRAHCWSTHMIPIREAYSHHWCGHYPRNEDAFVDPGYACSWGK
jgi:mannosyltransferase OCH1-like enzyme